MTRLAMLTTQIRGLGAVETWTARENETLRLLPARGGLSLRVDSGEVVVTQAGHLEDHVLGPGEVLRLDGRGLGVAWALAPSQVTIVRDGRRDATDPHRPDRPLAA